MLRHRWLAVAGFAGARGADRGVTALLGREFMPELEEGNMIIRGTFPVNVSLDEVDRDRSRIARHAVRDYPEVQAVLSQIGRPDDGTDPDRYYNAEFQVRSRTRMPCPRPRPQPAGAQIFGMRPAPRPS